VLLGYIECTVVSVKRDAKKAVGQSRSAKSLVTMMISMELGLKAKYVVPLRPETRFPLKHFPLNQVRPYL
jgi:hypothetical protein